MDPQGAFRSLASGMSQLVETIQQRLPASSVQLNCEVTGAAPGWRLQTTRGTVDCSAVISARRTWRPGCSSRLIERLRPCARRRNTLSTVSVALAWPREAVRHPLQGSRFVVTRASNPIRITACTWVSSKFEGRAPVGDVLLRAYLGGARSRCGGISDEAIVDITVRESKVLSITGAPKLSRVYRWRNAGAQHDDTAERVASLQQRLKKQRGLFVAGSGFRTVGVPVASPTADAQRSPRSAS